MEKIKVGDIVCRAIIEQSNLARHTNMSLSNIDDWAKELRVIKVTKKYITLEDDRRYSIEDNLKEKTTYGIPDFRIFRTMEDCYNHHLKKHLLDKIRMYFSPYGEINISLENLIEIDKLISEKNKKKKLRLLFLLTCYLYIIYNI